MLRPFFYAKACPCEEECSSAAFKRAQCWGWTREEAAARVSTHLQQSGHHRMAAADADQLAEVAEYEEDQCEAPEEPQPKRQQVDVGVKGKGKGKVIGQAPSSVAAAALQGVQGALHINS